jgi:hypothetical protein
LFAVRRSPAARQSCHCRARGARQRTATRQRVEEAHGKEARTAVRLFPVVSIVLHGKSSGINFYSRC